MDVVNNPMYATGVGLVLYGKRYGSEGRVKISDRGLFGKIGQGVKKFFSEIF